jgi:hypothetical protein
MLIGCGCNLFRRKPLCSAAQQADDIFRESTMSNPNLISLTVTVLVAFLAIAGGIVNERYKRHQNKIAVAAIMHAEISALIRLALLSSTVDKWESLAVDLEKGNNLTMAQIYVTDPNRGDIFNAYVDKFGLLDLKDATDIILFYEYIVGIRILIKNLVHGSWDLHPQAASAKAAQVRLGLQFWAKCEEISHRLLPSLQRTAMQRFVRLLP